MLKKGEETLNYFLSFGYTGVQSFLHVNKEIRLKIKAICISTFNNLPVKLTFTKLSARWQVSGLTQLC